MIERISDYRKPANDNHIGEQSITEKSAEVSVDGVKVSALRNRVQEVTDTLPHLLSPFHRVTEGDLVAPLSLAEVYKRINAIDPLNLPAEKAAYYEALLERITAEDDTI